MPNSYSVYYTTLVSWRRGLDSPIRLQYLKGILMDRWLSDVFESVEKEYNSLPEWKKKLIVEAELRKDKSRIRQKSETNQLKDYTNDWT